MHEILLFIVFLYTYFIYISLQNVYSALLGILKYGSRTTTFIHIKTQATFMFFLKSHDYFKKKAFYIKSSEVQMLVQAK